MEGLGALFLAVGLTATAVVNAGLLVSIFVPGRRFWPPGERDWRWWLYACCGAALVVGFVGTGASDWNSLGLPRPASLHAGLALLGLGGALNAASTVGLSIRETSGLGGDRLRTAGLYRVSRNPQVLGILIGFRRSARSRARSPGRTHRRTCPRGRWDPTGRRPGRARPARAAG